MSEEEEKGIFNSATATAETIASLTRTMNSARFNPLIMNQELMKMNYEVWASSCDSIFMECYASLSVEERLEGEKLKMLVSNYLKYKPIMVSSHNGETRVHNENYSKFLELINLYEKKMRIFLDKHRLATKDERGNY